LAADIQTLTRRSPLAGWHSGACLSLLTPLSLEGRGAGGEGRVTSRPTQVLPPHLQRRAPVLRIGQHLEARSGRPRANRPLAEGPPLPVFQPLRPHRTGVTPRALAWPRGSFFSTGQILAEYALAGRSPLRPTGPRRMKSLGRLAVFGKATVAKRGPIRALPIETVSCPLSEGTG